MKVKKILLSFMITLILFSNFNVKAASYSFNFTGPSEATSGQTVTLTITANGLTGKVNLSSTNASLSTNSVWVEKNSVNVTATITSFPAKITATPSELTDNEYNIVSISSKTITINQKQTSSGGSGSGNTGSGSTGGTNQGGSSGGSSGSNTGSGNSGSSGGTSSGGSSNSGGSTSGSGTSGGSSSNRPSSGGNSGSTSRPQTGTSSTQSPDGTYVPNDSNIDDGSVKSSNNYLSSITISAGNLSPEFYRETFEYTVENLPEDITELEINATAEDERAHISGLGVVSLNPGENRIQIEVTAENENVREYVLIVNRKQDLVESDLRLTTLEISQINKNGEFSTLEIPFDKETFEYNVEVDNDIVDLDVNPTVEREGIIVETTGEKNLKDGENIVSITLTAQNDENIQTSYVVKVNRKSGMEVSANVGQEDETWKIVVIGISLLILGIEIIAYIWMRKHNRTL